MARKKTVSKDSSLTDNRLRLMREKALKLHDDGVDNGSIARKLGLKPMQVAAYVAHRTMGTYE